MWTRLIKSKKDTTKLAQELSADLVPGSILALYGELGVGKTFFTQQLCHFLGVEEIVSSPSYVLLNEYRGIYPIAHFDFYRLGSAEEVLELGLQEFFVNHITIIEWPELAKDILPATTLHMKFSFINSHRIVEIKKGDR